MQVPAFSVDQAMIEEIEGVSLSSYIDWMLSGYYYHRQRRSRHFRAQRFQLRRPAAIMPSSPCSNAPTRLNARRWRLARFGDLTRGWPLSPMASARQGEADNAPRPLPKEKLMITIPPSIALPAGQKAMLELSAIGVQIYVCGPVKDKPGQFEWTLKEPIADLFDAYGKLVGRHFLDRVHGGPAWFYTADNSQVVVDGSKRTEAASTSSIAWLLVPAKAGTTDAGSLSNIKSVHRLETVGGLKPSKADATQLGQEVSVYYTAVYRFNA